MPTAAENRHPATALTARSRAYVTIPEAAEHFGVAVRTVRALIAAGELEAVRLGPRAVRIPAAALERAGRPYAAHRRRGVRATGGEPPGRSRPSAPPGVPTSPATTGGNRNADETERGDAA